MLLRHCEFSVLCIVLSVGFSNTNQGDFGRCSSRTISGVSQPTHPINNLYQWGVLSISSFSSIRLSDDIERLLFTCIVFEEYHSLVCSITRAVGFTSPPRYTGVGQFQSLPFCRNSFCRSSPSQRLRTNPITEFAVLSVINTTEFR